MRTLDLRFLIAKHARVMRVGVTVSVRSRERRILKHTGLLHRRRAEYLPEQNLFRGIEKRT